MNIKKIDNNVINSGYSTTEKVSENFRIHCHESYEILFVVDGSVRYIIEGETYYPARNSFLLIPSGVVHGIEENMSEGYSRYVAHIKYEELNPNTQKLLKKAFSKQRYYVPQDSRSLRECFDDLYSAYEMDKELFTAALDALLLKIILVCASTDAEAPRTVAGKLCTEIINYVNENYAKKITLDSIASEFYITKHHLNVLFKGATGITVWEYVIRKRIYLAKTLIRQGVSATDAAYQVGFSDYSVFYKAYIKRVGENPKQEK